MTRSVLLVEDDPGDLLLFQHAWGRVRDPPPLEVARDGQEALERLIPNGGKAPPLEADLVLLDIQMPRVSGLEALSALRKHPATRDATIVIFSSSNDPKDVDRARKFGANGYVQKPVAFPEFVKSVAHIVNRWCLGRTGGPWPDWPVRGGSPA